MRAGRPSTADHGSTSRYRAGCRCPLCRAAHAAEKQQYAVQRNYGVGSPMGPQVRRSVLRSLRAGLTVAQAAAENGVTHQMVYGACKAVPEFGEQVDELTRATD